MGFCLFVVWSARQGLGLEERTRETLARHLRATPELIRAHVYEPESAQDPFLHDAGAPALVLQLYFADLPALEAAAARNGHLQRLADPAAFPTLAQPGTLQQVMLVREFPVPDPQLRGAPHCTYLVAYEGPAQDFDAWLGFYLEHHPATMATMPGIRELEVYTRVDAVSFLPWPRATHMQRNKVAFDSAAALTAALNSPARAEMRAHFRSFPPYQGAVTHYPMATRILRP